MEHDIFYYGTIKTLITAFGILFSNIKFINDHNQEITVPIRYSPREKFTEIANHDRDLDAAALGIVLPRMGFFLDSISFATERFNNPLSKIQDKNIENRYMFSRVPYDFNFSLFVATTKFEDSLKISEQILPFFVPEINISIRDKEDFNLVTDIPIVLNTSSFNIEYEGSYDDHRSIEWQFDFTMKAYLYSNLHEQDRIKKTLIELSQPDIEKRYAEFISEVIPKSANKTDPHTVKDTINEWT